ncbi:MAG: UvrD-helicase domain-containing protein [Planctomycetota bacterium]
MAEPNAPSTPPLEIDVSDDPLLAGLTPPQLEAVTHIDGPAQVLAGPGSGKTRVITRRVAHLIHRVGIAPWNILAITFTNKAAAEMRDRVGQLVTERQSRATNVATFHSLCARLLRQFADHLGLPPGYSIYDTADQKRAMKQVLSDLEINPKNFAPASMLSAISNAKNELVGPTEFATNAGTFYDRTVAKVYKRYAEVLEKNQALDFDDLLMKTVQLLRKHPDVAEELRDKYQYVLIDEYQDTNHAQFMLASVLGAHGNVMAVGDPDQSIYGWRGANIRNILEFESHYPDAKVIRLEQNYRSTKTILQAADGLIQHNTGRKHKTLWTDNDNGEPVRVAECGSELDEAKHVIDRFVELNQAGVPWGGMAVFYRMNSLSRVIEDELRDRGIPYQIARGTAFYDRKEIKDAVAYLRVVANPADEVNLLRVINTPSRGISATTVKALQARSLTDAQPIDVVIENPMRLTEINTRAQNAVAKFSRTVTDWRSTAGLIAGDLAASNTLIEPSLREFVERLVRESGLEDHYRKDKSDPDQERLANLGELVSSAQQFEERLVIERVEQQGEDPPTLAEKLLAFLEQISLVSDIDGVDADQGSVTLMTLHAAKGLEFPAVAVVGFEDGLLPHDRANKDPNELEEERRLAFVGITRAMQHLELTHARRRTVFGQSNLTIPSRFLNELPEQAIERLESDGDGLDAFLSGGGGRAQRERAAQRESLYPKGTVVRHPQFGIGRVMAVNAMGAHTRATIQFNTVGKKTLVLEYARLEPVMDPNLGTAPRIEDEVDDDLPF